MLENRIPFVGEIVLFTPNQDDTVAKSNHNQDPIPAIVTRVHGSLCVNLKIIPDCGSMQDRTSVVHSSQNPYGYHFNYIEEEEEKVIGLKPNMNVEASLVSFGNFLLGKYYVKDEIGEEAGVTHADLENWKETL